MYPIRIYFEGFARYPSEINQVITIFARDVNVKLILSTNNQAAIRVYLTPSEIMKKKFPQTHLLGLSVCDMNTRQVYINETNWMRKPHASDIQSLYDYRIFLLIHEILHAFGLGHINNINRRATETVDAPSMFQPSKSYKERGDFRVPNPIRIVISDNHRKTVQTTALSIQETGLNN